MRKLSAVVIVLMVAAVALFAAPTSIKIAMLVGPSLANGGVLVLAPNGQVQVATLGAGVSLVAGGSGGWIIQATRQAVVGGKPTRQTDGTYALAQAVVPGTLQVYRNGVRQSVGDDYTFDAAAKRISPVAGLPWSSDDLVLAGLRVLTCQHPAIAAPFGSLPAIDSGALNDCTASTA